MGTATSDVNVQPHESELSSSRAHHVSHAAVRCESESCVQAPWPSTFAWGESWRIGTAAFWVEQCRHAERVELRLGQSLLEEVVACLLGGWGVPGDIGVAAFKQLQQAQLLNPPADAKAIEDALGQPLHVPGRERAVRYRFPKQRSSRVARAIEILASARMPDDPIALRQWLASNIPGVGLKTASWIVRNLSADAPIAVIDVHVRRAGIGAGFFDPSWQLPRDYHLFEAAFVEVARYGKVPPGHLDHTVWSTLASVPSHTRIVLCGRASADT